MRNNNTVRWAGAMALALGVGFVTGVAQESSGSHIVGVYGVGGVISDDGILWQYMPEERRWMTIDEAFDAGGTLRAIAGGGRGTGSTGCWTRCGARRSCACC